MARLSVLRDEGGNSLIEMGLAVPLLTALLVGMVDLSLAYSERLQLEQSAQRTIELVMQRDVPTGTLVTALQTEALAAVNDPAATATARRWLECNGAAQTNFNTTCPAGQTFARYVDITITKPFTPMFSTRYFPGANADGTVPLVGRAGIRIQ